MTKKESSFLNMVLTLLIVTLLSSTSLGIIYSITKEPIEKAKIAIKIAAINEVVPEFNNIPLNESESIHINKDSLVIYPAKKDGQKVGTAIETFSNKGFGGKIKLMVGFLPDGTLNNISVMEHKETPGLGDKMQKEKSSFSEQFAGKNPSTYKLKVVKDGGDVDAITAATISSRAFCDAVQSAYNTFISLEVKNDSTQVEN